NPVFNLVDVLLIVMVALGSMIICFAVAFAIYFALHPSRSVDPKAVAYNAFLVIPVQVVSYILIVGLMVFIVWQRYRADFLQAVRWNMPTAKRAWAALAGGVGLAFASQLLSLALQRWIPKSLPIDQYFRTTASAYMLAGFGIFIAPLAEHLFFPRFLYPAHSPALWCAPGDSGPRRGLRPASLRAVGACLGAVADPIRRGNGAHGHSRRDKIRGPLRVHPHGIQLHLVYGGLHCVFRLSTFGA